MNIRFKEKEREKHYFPAYFTISTFNRSSNYSSQKHLVIECILEFSGNTPRSSTQYLNAWRYAPMFSACWTILWSTNTVGAQEGATHLPSQPLIPRSSKACPQCDLILNPSRAVLSQGVRDRGTSCQCLSCAPPPPL